jgi:hypothetical protein
MLISCNQNLHYKIQCKKVQKQNYNSFFYIFDTTKNSHNNMTWKSLQKSVFVYWKLQSKYSKSSMVCWNEIKTTTLNLWYIKIEFVVSATKYLPPSPYSKIVCLRMNIFFLELPSLGSPQVTINMIQNQTRIRSLNFECPMINPYP